MVLNKNCSTEMLNKLPKKIGDLGSLNLPCQFGNLATYYVLVNLVEVQESNLTLRVGDDLVTFGVDRPMKHSRFSDDTVFSVDTFEKLMEKELAEWKEDKVGGFASLSEGDFDAEKVLKEIERLLEESEFEEITRHTKEQT